MKIAILKERRIAETRVAATPDSITRLRALGCSVAVESGAGLTAGVSDQHYRDAGAEVAGDPAATLSGAQALFAVQRPMGAGDAGPDIVSMLRPGSALVGLLAPYADRQALDAYARGGITAFAMELVPRISRAQSMDALSSQASLAGYRAVIDAVAELGRAVPMMMTAAGTIAPAKVFVLGAGVAGLQAIATARRLGAVVSATDVRPAAKEQVQSLGARFVWIEDAEASASETKGGYAKAMSPDYLRRQVALVAETLRQQDIVICTAMIPGKPAPRLVSAEMVRSMRSGSVIVDLAVESGGNCELSRPGEVVEVEGVRVIGHRNVPGRVAVDASALYARNLAAFATLLVDPKDKALRADGDDEILKASRLTLAGAVVHPAFATSVAAA